MARTCELQRRDLQLSEIIDYPESYVLPLKDCTACKLLLMGDHVLLPVLGSIRRS